jgi:hypothetical protein
MPPFAASNLSQPAVDLVPTRENAAHHLIVQHHQALARRRARHRRQESNRVDPNRALAALT